VNILFQIDGGLGKSIMATAVVKVIRKRYKNANIIVVTAYPDVFLNNPHISYAYRTDNVNGFYLKYIKDQDCKIFVEDPYRHSDFILGKPKHILKTWCELFGLRYNNEIPELYFANTELEYFEPYYKTDKPILAIQPNGGPADLGYQYAWTRDIPDPTITEIIEHYKNDYSIIHIKRKDQKVFPDTMQAVDGFRSIAILLKLSSKRLFIDSFAQHLSCALNLKSTVCWVSTSPKIFGYKLHDNIMANPFTKEQSLNEAAYQPYALSQDIHSMPYWNLNEVFDTNKIIESINKQ